MSAQHTQGLLLEPCNFGASKFELQGGGRRVAVVETLADARRLWACWNACQGLSTEVLETMPPAYMLAKLQMVMPMFQEARDALTVITEAQRKLHGISATLAIRMDEAGTFGVADWQKLEGGAA